MNMLAFGLALKMWFLFLVCPEPVDSFCYSVLDYK